MEIKTKRIILQAAKNLSKLLLFMLLFLSYSIMCFWLSKELSDDLYFGFAGIFFPAIIAAVWDMSKSQVESQIYDEERTIKAMEREYN